MDKLLAKEKVSLYLYFKCQTHPDVIFRSFRGQVQFFFHLICNMPLFLEEKCRRFWKGSHVFRSHWKSCGSLKSILTCFYPTTLKKKKQPCVQYQNQFKLVSHSRRDAPPPYSKLISQQQHIVPQHDLLIVDNSGRID